MVPCRVAREMAWSTTLQAAMTAILKADHLVMRTHVQVRKHRQYPKKHKTTKIILFLRPQILHWKLSDGWRWLESHQILGNRGLLPNGFQNLELSWECFRRDPVATAPWIFHEQLQGRIQNRFPWSHACLQDVWLCNWLKGWNSQAACWFQSFFYLFYFFLQQFHKQRSRQCWVITISEVRTSQYAQLKVMISMLPLAADRAVFLDAEGSVWEAVVNCLKMALSNSEHV